ncbi:MAG: hypothetical protein PXZ08_05630, partial [Actinomycetota bacterium]|nr:hypothetical protein [Actinomycetota bacterium]
MNIVPMPLRRRLGVLFIVISMVFGVLSALAANPASADTLSASQLVAGSAALSGVACPTATTCEAVGTGLTNTTQGTTSGPGLIIPITNGVTSTAQAVTGTLSLSAIACPTATSCVALGTSSSGAVVVSITLAATDTFGVSSTVSGIKAWNAIACPTSTQCEAVAGGFSGPMFVPITSGTPGTAQAVTGSYYLSGIACPSATTCEAVGTFENGASSFVGDIIPIVNGVPGALQQVPGIQNLNGIACPTATSCEVAGTNPGPSLGEWVDAAVSIELGTTDAFGPVWPVQVVDGRPAVACATSTSCAVVDSNVQVYNGFISNGTETPFTNGFPGETQAAPSTAGLTGAACPTATSCIGVGSQTISLGSGNTGVEGAVTQIGVTAPTAVSNLAFTPSNAGASVNNVTYTFNFTAATSMASGSSSIDLAATAGTVFPVPSGCGEYVVTDTTTGAVAGSCSVTQQTTVSGGGGNGVVVTNPLSVAAGDTVTVVVNGVTNSAAVGSQNVELSTSSDTIPVSTSFGVQQSYSVSGQITFTSGTPTASAPVSGALVEACAAVGSFCTKAFSTTDTFGNYSLLLTSGSYLLTAFPPAGTSAMAQTTGALFTVGTQPQSGVNLTLAASTAQTLLTGETIDSPNFGLQTSSSATPSINWEEPSTVHLPASLFPVGVTTVVTDLAVTGVNTQTGLVDTLYVDLGGQATIASGAAQGLTGASGLIVGPSGIDITVPPVAPIHGPVTLSLGTYTVGAGLNVPTGVALAGSKAVVFTNGALNQPTPLVVTDFQVDHSIGMPTIVGPDRASFSVQSVVNDRLQGDTTTPSCSSSTTISQNVT